MGSFNKYKQGHAGTGAPDYTSPSWRAGDQQRQYEQNQNFIHKQKEKANQIKSNSSSTGYSSSDKDSFSLFYFLYTLCAIVGFVVASSYSLNETVENYPHFKTFVENDLRTYVEVEVGMPEDSVGWLIIGVLSIIGFLIRKFLRIVFAGTLVIWLIYTIVNPYFDQMDKKVVANDTSTENQ